MPANNSAKVGYEQPDRAQPLEEGALTHELVGGIPNGEPYRPDVQIIEAAKIQAAAIIKEAELQAQQIIAHAKVQAIEIIDEIQSMSSDLLDSIDENDEPFSVEDYNVPIIDSYGDYFPAEETTTGHQDHLPNDEASGNLLDPDPNDEELFSELGKEDKDDFSLEDSVLSDILINSKTVLAPTVTIILGEEEPLEDATETQSAGLSNADYVSDYDPMVDAQDKKPENAETEDSEDSEDGEGSDSQPSDAGTSSPQAFESDTESFEPLDPSISSILSMTKEERKAAKKAAKKSKKAQKRSGNPRLEKQAADAQQLINAKKALKEASVPEIMQSSFDSFTAANQSSETLPDKDDNALSEENEPEPVDAIGEVDQVGRK